MQWLTIARNVISLYLGHALLMRQVFRPGIWSAGKSYKTAASVGSLPQVTTVMNVIRFLC